MVLTPLDWVFRGEGLDERLLLLSAVLAAPLFSEGLVDFISSPEEPPSGSIAGRMSGASSRSACPVFLMALASPMSYHIPDPFSSFRNLPAGSIVRMSWTMPAAMCAFWSFLVVGARYSFFFLWMTSRNCTFPGWLLIRPPRPQRTSFTFGSAMGPMPFGGTVRTGRGCAVDLLWPAAALELPPVSFSLLPPLLLLLVPLFQRDSTTIAAACRLCRFRFICGYIAAL